MTTLYNKDYEHAYERKKSDSISRGIEFLLTLEEYVAIMKARPTLVCGYTNRPFIMNKGSDHKDWPTLERCDENKPYEKGNIMFVSNVCNKLKNEYIELGKSRKGIKESYLYILRSIEKTISQPEILNKRLQPYQEIFDKVAQREQEQLDKQTRKQELSEACEKAKRVNEAKAKAEEQLALSKHYAAISEEITKLTGMPYNLSVKVHRDIYRRGKDAITGEKFGSMEDKFLWIPDKVKVIDRGWIEKGDFIVVHRNTQELLDKLSVCGNLKVSALNILKHV